VLCQFEKAEDSLKQALALDQQDSGPVYMDLVELGRLKFHQRKLEESGEYYKRGLLELKRVNAQTQAPIGYSEILDEYAAVLAALGRPDDSETKMQEAREIRYAHPNMDSLTSDTPYGQACEQVGK
jgi:tetratricopeptide (TPR) repeat protein